MLLQHYIKLQLVENLGYIVCLSNTGLLYLHCSYTGVRIPLQSNYAIDFVMLSWNEKKAAAQLMVMEKCGGNKTVIRVISIPDMKCDYEIAVPRYNTSFPKYYIVYIICLPK